MAGNVFRLLGIIVGDRIAGAPFVSTLRWCGRRAAAMRRSDPSLMGALRHSARALFAELDMRQKAFGQLHQQRPLSCGHPPTHKSLPLLTATPRIHTSPFFVRGRHLGFNEVVTHQLIQTDEWSHLLKQDDQRA